ncbi:PstS family phosphate ABC transporter substrate-binding protein [Virgibacillus proomii]|uniref:PstS family phosphate ABC transporter substrate-binding protein n=1 Tax=Virgibacillus proomii TaxID=84407 RepID=UPI001C110B4C|nr:PstS family phosphate ABC transporter substrate-binding protein [Virgibacillus proomii]MBU5266595.1 PstS family phosphate ABC transporter substrate-binding protein [Virgibacillus proomii]
MKFKKYLMFLLIAALAVVVAACGSDSKEGDNKEKENETSENTGAESDSKVEGSVVIDGSGTVYPLMAKLAEEYMVEKPDVSVEVSRAGTSAGFEKFLVKDGTDFNDASRVIKDEEKAKAEELGMEIKELKVALDGLTIVTHPDNDWATELTQDQVKDIFLGKSTKWSDINPKWPDEKIQTYGPNENHGTYEFFYENILEEQDLVSDINLQQDYSTLVTLVAEDKNAIGFFGFGYYDNNKDKVKAVKIDFGEGPVEPSLDTIAEDGDYAGYTRPVFTYLNVDHAKEKPQVLDYALFIMNNVNKFAGETGFAPIPEEEAKTLISDLEALKK